MSGHSVGYHYPVGEFFDKVYAAVRMVPRGYVTTYGDVARAVGRPRSARYVGFALRANPSPGDQIPCHRVVFGDGRICEGFAFGGPEVQRGLLQDEGVCFIDDEHVDLARCRYAFTGDEDGRPTDVDWVAEMKE